LRWIKNTGAAHNHSTRSTACAASQRFRRRCLCNTCLRSHACQFRRHILVDFPQKVQILGWRWRRPHCAITVPWPHPAPDHSPRRFLGFAVSSDFRPTVGSSCRMRRSFSVSAAAALLHPSVPSLLFRFHFPAIKQIRSDSVPPARLRHVPTLYAFLHDLPLLFRGAIYAWSPAYGASIGGRFYLTEVSSVTKSTTKTSYSGKLLAQGARPFH